MNPDVIAGAVAGGLVGVYVAHVPRLARALARRWRLWRMTPAERRLAQLGPVRGVKAP